MAPAAYTPAADKPLGVIGVPTSAGAFAPGQEQAPAALREAGLIELVEVGTSAPLLEPGQVVLLGWGPEQAQPRERQAIERLSIEVVGVDEVGADPATAAARAPRAARGPGRAPPRPPRRRRRRLHRHAAL